MSVVMDSNQPAQQYHGHGRTIDDYRVVRTLSESNHASVHEARNPFGNPVVIKQLARGAPVVAFDNLQREFRVFTHGSRYFPHAFALRPRRENSPEQPYVVMEYLARHETLEHRMAAIKEYAPRMGLDQAAHICIQVLGALQQLHSRYGIAHGDIAPQNILVAENQAVWDRGAVKLIDLGMAEPLDQRVAETLRGSAGTSATRFFGTPGYASPERAGVLARPITEQSDVYSVGAVLYELTTGHRLFGIPDLSPRDPLTPTITKACAYLPEHRHDSARALAADLEALVNHRPAQRVPRTNKFWEALEGIAFIGVLAVSTAYDGIFEQSNPFRGKWKQFEW